jgi:hypothetical protein
MRTIVLALAALIALTEASSAQTVACYTGDELGTGGQYAATQITVQRDGRCEHGGLLSEVTLDTPPRNGRVEISGRGLTYYPNPGFVGSDSYVFSGNSIGSGGRGVSRPFATGRISVTVAVTVVQ